MSNQNHKRCWLGVLNWSLLGAAFVMLQCSGPSSLAECGLKFSGWITVPLMGKSLPPPPPRAGGGSRIFLLPTILFHPLSYPVVNSYRNLYCHLPSQMNRHSCLMCFTWGSISNWLCDVVPTFPLWTLPSVSCCIRQSLKWRQIVDNRGIREGSSSPPVGHFSIY